MLKDSLRSVNILLEKHYRKSFRKGINRGEHARKIGIALLSITLFILGAAPLSVIGYGSGFIYKKEKI